MSPALSQLLSMLFPEHDPRINCKIFTFKIWKNNFHTYCTIEKRTRAIFSIVERVLNVRYNFTSLLLTISLFEKHEKILRNHSRTEVYLGSESYRKLLIDMQQHLVWFPGYIICFHHYWYFYIIMKVHTYIYSNRCIIKPFQGDSYVTRIIFRLKIFESSLSIVGKSRSTSQKCKITAHNFDRNHRDSSMALHTFVKNLNYFSIYDRF